MADNLRRGVFLDLLRNAAEAEALLPEPHKSNFKAIIERIKAKYSSEDPFWDKEDPIEAQIDE